MLVSRSFFSNTIILSCATAALLATIMFATNMMHKYHFLYLPNNSSCFQEYMILYYRTQPVIKSTGYTATSTKHYYL